MTDWKAVAHRYRRLLRAELAGSKKLHGALKEEIKRRMEAERSCEALSDETARRVAAECGAVGEEAVIVE